MSVLSWHYQGLGFKGSSELAGGVQVTRQLEVEKATLLEKKRREQDERRRKQEELDQILLENRRKVSFLILPE